MQQKLLVFILILLGFSLSAAEDEINLKTSISEVTVYQQNALIHREGSIIVPKGNSTIVIEDLHHSIQPQDVRINAKGDFSVLAISYRYHIDTLSGLNSMKRRNQITAEIQALQTRIQRENGFLDIYNKEEQMLLNNQNFTHKDEGVDIDRLAKASDFLRSRLFDIKQRRLEIEEEVSALQREINSLYTEQNQLEPLNTHTTLEMLVRVNAKSQNRGLFTADYRTYNAGWAPSYDAIVESVSDPLKLEYKAKVYQNTGEDWEDVVLTVATGNPNVNKKKPNLLPWYISGNVQHKPQYRQNGSQTDYNAFLRSQPYNKEIRKVSGQLLDQSGEPLPYATITCYGTSEGTTTDLSGYYSIDIPTNVSTLQFAYVGYTYENLYVSSSVMNVVLKNSVQLDAAVINSYSETTESFDYNQFGIAEDEELNYDSSRRDNSDFFLNKATDFAQVSVSHSAINTKFEIDAFYTIPSDGKEYAVQIQEHDLEAHYIFQCTPKLDATAFLTAQVTDWENFNLLAGPMNIYFEDEFIGISNLDLSQAEDTLNLSLGEDQNIFVERRKVKSENKRQSFGSHKIVEREFEILVRNNKNENITLIIEDQIPISNTEEIEVDAETLSGGKVDELTGKVKWTLNLNSGKKKTLKFKYSVKYPKSMRLSV